MSFYRRIIDTIIDNKYPTIDDYLMNPRACTIAYIMNINDLFDDKLVRCGIISISEKTIMKSMKIPHPTNNELYDLLYYLDSIQELENYLSMNSRMLPVYDSFYEDMNKKLGFNNDNKKRRKINVEKICPSCKMIPYYDFTDTCDYCKMNHDDEFIFEG